MKFKACMFDIDGTLTNLGERFIPDFLKKKLNELIEKGVPLAVCSGRHHPDSIVNRLEGISFKKWTLIAENGAVGYFFGSNGWEEFYRVPWPENTIKKEELAFILQSRMKFSKFFDNPSTLIFRPGETLDIDMQTLAKKCDEYQAEVEKIFKEKNVSGLRTNNSRIGIIITPLDGDKDRGVLEFANFLEIKDTKEIACIGDQPEEGYNDHYFLNGKYGTPFAVNGPAETLKILDEIQFVI